MGCLRIGLCVDVGVLARAGVVPALESLDVLVFPELVDGGYAARARGRTPHHLDDPFIQMFRDVSRAASLYCIAGSVCLRADSSSSTNTSLVFSGGRLVHRYDKMHLFTPMYDHKYFSPGKQVGTFTISTRQGRVRAGVVICYDLRFPELVRAMALEGMKIVFVPARWPRVRDDAWFTLLKARAMENQIFVVGCNARGNEGGYSYAFDPLGRMIFSNRHRPHQTLATFSLDLGKLKEARALHNNLRDAVLL
jgi:omega-amidase